MALTQIRKEQIASVDVDTLDCSTELKTFLNTANSANLAAAVSDETGNGSLVFANGPTLIGPALGTPASGVLTNATGLPIATGLAVGSSADLRGRLNDESGTGLAVFNNGPTLIAPALGTPASGILDNCTTASPTNPTDIANKQYVDALSAGLSWKESVKVATSGNITLSGDSQTIDDVAVVADDRVLVKAQTDSAENGIYVAAAGAWSRSLDMDDAGEFSGSAVFVEQGTASGDQGYVCTNDGDITVDTTEVSWTQFTGTGAFNFRVGLIADGNNIDVSFASYVAMESDFSAAAGQANSAASPVTISYRKIDESDVGNGQAPVASANSDLARQQLFFQVFLNGILLSGRLASDAAGIEDVVNLLSGEGSGDDAGISYDYVAKITELSGEFELYMQTEDLDSSDILTLSYAK